MKCINFKRIYDDIFLRILIFSIKCIDFGKCMRIRMVLKEILCYVNVFVIKKLYVKISFIIYNNEFF